MDEWYRRENRVENRHAFQGPELQLQLAPADSPASCRPDRRPRCSILWTSSRSLYPRTQTCLGLRLLPPGQHTAQPVRRRIVDLDAYASPIDLAGVFSLPSWCTCALLIIGPSPFQ